MEMIFITTLIESILVLVLLAIPFVITQLVRRKRYKGRITKEEMITGIVAKAVILNIEQTAMLKGQAAMVRLQMQVIPEKGRNFIAEINEEITAAEMSHIRNGSTVKVRYNPANIRDITLVRR